MSLDRPPEDFKGKRVLGSVVELCQEKRQNAAARYFIDNLKDITSSRLSLKDKLNHLMYIPRVIQGSAGTKHGYQKLLRKAKDVETAIAGRSVPPGGAFVDLGCGAHDPLGLATYYYLNGFEPCYGIDLKPMAVGYFSALSMYDILVNAKAFPERYCRKGVATADLSRRIDAFDLAGFEHGDFARGLGAAGNKVLFETTDIVNASVTARSASLIVSFAVLEHVEDIDEVCAHLFDLLQPGGLLFHFVDLVDHRIYAAGGRRFGPLAFLADDFIEENTNRLRAPDIVAAHRRAGFEILSDKRRLAEMPEPIRQNLIPRYRRMSIEDLSAIKLTMLARRPAAAAPRP